jgi:hypothetical protein
MLQAPRATGCTCGASAGAASGSGGAQPRVRRHQLHMTCPGWLRRHPAAREAASAANDMSRVAQAAQFGHRLCAWRACTWGSGSVNLGCVHAVRAMDATADQRTVGWLGLLPWEELGGRWCVASGTGVGSARQESLVGQHAPEVSLLSRAVSVEAWQKSTLNARWLNWPHAWHALCQPQACPTRRLPARGMAQARCVEGIQYTR